MPLARTVLSCLERLRIPYDIISHPHSIPTRATAEAAAVPASQIAKPVILGDEQGYLMVVIPGDRQVDIEALSRRLGRRLQLVHEDTFAHLFTDCELGAVPPLGSAYGVETLVDDRVLAQEHVCFVGGDHDELVRVTGDAFRLLIRDAPHAPLTADIPSGAQGARPRP